MYMDCVKIFSWKKLEKKYKQLESTVKILIWNLIMKLCPAYSEKKGKEKQGENSTVQLEIIRTIGEEENCE